MLIFIQKELHRYLNIYVSKYREYSAQRDIMILLSFSQKGIKWIEVVSVYYHILFPSPLRSKKYRQ